jgi:AcrR family transcriptional regulator
LARPVTIRDEDILEAARAAFLEGGIRTTTAEIAKRAGVSEGILFKRFHRKEELFRAALGGQYQPDNELHAALAARIGKGTVEETLVMVGNALMDKFFLMMPDWMMAWANTRGEATFEWGKGPPPNMIKGQRALAGYIEGEMRLGRVKRGDAEIFARTFSGSIYLFCFTEVMFGKSPELPMPRDAFVRGLVQSLWQGLAPEELARKTSRKR